MKISEYHCFRQRAPISIYLPTKVPNMNMFIYLIIHLNYSYSIIYVATVICTLKTSELLYQIVNGLSLVFSQYLAV